MFNWKACESDARVCYSFVCIHVLYANRVKHIQYIDQTSDAFNANHSPNSIFQALFKLFSIHYTHRHCTGFVSLGFHLAFTTTIFIGIHKCNEFNLTFHKEQRKPSQESEPSVRSVLDPERRVLWLSPTPEQSGFAVKPIRKQRNSRPQRLFLRLFL